MIYKKCDRLLINHVIRDNFCVNDDNSMKTTQIFFNYKIIDKTKQFLLVVIMF